MAEGPKKGKGADITKWEDELRRSLATKKASTQPALSKQAQALVQAQLDKEAVVRRHVASLKAHLERALAFIQSMILVNVPELRVYVSPIASLLLQGALAQGSRLVGSAAFDTFIVGGLSCDMVIVGVNGLSDV